MKRIIFDCQTYMANFAGMEDLARETIKSFLNTLPKMLSDIQHAIEEKNSSDLELHAHTLKGAVSNFYAEPARLLAWELEKLGKNKNMQNATDLIKDLVQELKLLENEFNLFLKQAGTQ